MPEHAVCATQAPPWHTSGTVLLRHRRAFSSQPHLKFRSLRHSGASPEQLTCFSGHTDTGKGLKAYNGTSNEFVITK